MKNRTLRSLFICALMALGPLAHASEESITDNVLKLVELQDKFGNYRLTSGDSFCESRLTLQSISLKLGGEQMSVVELVETEIASEDYIWRKGLSTLFVHINGKKVHDRSINSRNQAYRSEYKATYEDEVLTGILQYKNSFALIRLDKESIVTTLDFSGAKGSMAYRQVETDEDKNTVSTNCEYERVY